MENKEKLNLGLNLVLLFLLIVILIVMNVVPIEDCDLCKIYYNNETLNVGGFMGKYSEECLNEGISTSPMTLDMPNVSLD